MSLEAALAANTAALEAHTAALLKAAGLSGEKKAPATTAEAGATEGAKKGAGRPKKPAGPTAEEVAAIAVRVKEELGKPAAVALIKEMGAAKLEGVKPEKYAEFITKAEALLAANAEEGDEEGDEDDGL